VICIYDVIGTEERGITALRYERLYAQITSLYVSDVLEIGDKGVRGYPGGS
jgi:hypothetical protein